MTWEDAQTLQNLHIRMGPECSVCGCPRHAHRGRTHTPGLQAFDGYCAVCKDDEHTYTPVGITYTELSGWEFTLQKRALELPAMELWPTKPKKRRWRWLQ